MGRREKVQEVNKRSPIKLPSLGEMRRKSSGFKNTVKKIKRGNQLYEGFNKTGNLQEGAVHNQLKNQR